MRHLACLIAIVMLLSSLSVSPAPAEAVAPAITVLSCDVGVRANGTPGIEVGFRNDSSETLKSIVWRAKFWRGWIDITDNGTYAPSAVVTHTAFWSVQGVQVWGYYHEGIDACSVVATKAANAASWSDPTFSPKTLYQMPKAQSAMPVSATIDNPSRDPVGFLECGFSIGPARVSLFKPLVGRGTLSARLRNLSDQTIDRVVIRAAYQSGGFNFVYGTTISPGATTSSSRMVHFLGEAAVDSKLVRDDLPLVHYTGEWDPSNCTTVSVHFTDGTTWVNPTVGPTEPPIPTPLPTLPS